MEKVEIRPRRIGHVNLYVANLERSIGFYEKACGIELVRLEPAIRGAFHSTGRTHHDVGLIEVSKGVDRIGRDGKVQIAATRGTRPGLNHLAWEMENEAELVGAYQRLLKSRYPIQRLFDHLISHSIYIADPDGNMHEFYSDAMPDWWRIFNLEHEDLVTSDWDPFIAPPSTIGHYPVDPPVREVPGSALRPRGITGASIHTNRFDEMKRFFIEIAGLSVTAETDGEVHRAVLAGSCGDPNVTLIAVSNGAPIGLRLFSFQLDGRTGLEAAADGLVALTGERPRVVEDERRRAIVLTDPDGFQVEFYHPRSGEIVEPLAA
jgi:catechol 2,3-dioxygenase